MDRHTGALTVAEGADSIISITMLAKIEADGPTRAFTDRLGPLAW